MSVLNETERQALLDALDDEYRAWATYDQVVRDFGPERPFVNIPAFRRCASRGAGRGARRP